MSLERQHPLARKSPFQSSRALDSGWRIVATPAGRFASPGELTDADLEWVDATVPCTAASALRAASSWDLDAPQRRFDADDWWFRCSFESEPACEAERRKLKLEGLATVASVWLNGEPILQSANMFRCFEVDIGSRLRPHNELVICCHSLDALLKGRRARPRWKAPMVENQQLRWFRTTLLGRTPGWSLPAAAVGPWRPITLETRRHLSIEDIELRATVRDGAGVVALRCKAIPLDGDLEILEARMRIRRPDCERQVDLERTTLDDGRVEARATLSIERPQLWWPHTHGEPALYEATLLLRIGVPGRMEDVAVDLAVDLGHIGFRSIAIDTHDDGFAVVCNGVPIFCRGACWMPPDPVALNTGRDEIERTLDLARTAGMNMIRISGAAVYESDDFFDACDRMGLLVWQDLMFANLDYPDTPEFVAEITEEIRQQVDAVALRPCIAVICGNSEVEQQAAMFGAARELWQPRLFHETIAAIVRERCPDVPYWPSSAHGGSFPHQGDVGTTSYYGVGAYLRSLEDARRSAVRFATECLAFANVPEEACIARMPALGPIKMHHPSWKARVPRDLGAGWDFEDVRDHYLQRWFGVDPLRLRYSQHDRYLALGRVVTGEVMSATFVEWRRRRSTCRGGLIWFLRDLWAGAGWGVLDDSGAPKAAYYFLRRVLQPLMIGVTDEGGNGLVLHVANERSGVFDGSIELTCYRNAEIRVEAGSASVQLAPRETQEIGAASLLPHFSDLNHAYRFGAPSVDLVVATLRDRSGAAIATGFHHPLGVPVMAPVDLGLEAKVERSATGEVHLAVSARRFAYAVSIDIDHCEVEDQYFHLEPGSSRRIRLQPRQADKKLYGNVAALNGMAPIRFELTQ